MVPAALVRRRLGTGSARGHLIGPIVRQNTSAGHTRDGRRASPWGRAEIGLPAGLDRWRHRDRPKFGVRHGVLGP